MSSDDDGTEKVPKRRRTQRACDACRQRKIRCDGVQLSNNRCTNCVDYGLACNYDNKRRGRPKSYVEILEGRVKRLQDLLAKVSPEALEHLDTFADAPFPSSEPDHRFPLHNPAPVHFVRHTYTSPPSSLEEEDAEVLTDHLGKLSIHTYDQRFFGKSSAAMLVKTAFELKREHSGVKEGTGARDDGSSDARWPWTNLTSSPAPAAPQYTFPPPDLLTSLIDLYFVHMNRYMPLLHRPTFERAVAQSLHHTDPAFAATVLLVCAVAARFSDDPRVMDDLEDDVDPAAGDGGSDNKDREGRNAHSCGWKWFMQVPTIKTPPLSRTCLYDLQFYALLAQFLQGSSVPEACWSVVGIGIRIVQDVGAHRRKARGVHTVEDELWKRGFWVLVCMDRLFSSSLGRPLSIHNEDFDLDMPIECDDEYWEHPDPQLCWRQPTPDQTPSVVTYFNVFIRLNQILALMLRMVYAINKSKLMFGFVGQQWEESIVSELDSALNAWLDDIPNHLRWDPTCANDLWFNQSASLYCAYYHTRILVHRPFIPSPHKPDVALSFPSLTICTNAARACSHVLEAHGKRFNITPPQMQTTAFSAAVVLLVNIWGGKRSGLSTDFGKDSMADVQRCMHVLKASEPRWYLAGRFNHILRDLVSVGDLPFPQRASNMPTTAQKRRRSPQREERDCPMTLPAASESGNGSGSALATQSSSLPQPMLPEYDYDPNQVYPQQHQHQPVQQQHALHNIVNPQDWYHGATSAARTPQSMPQKHPQDHSQNIPFLPSTVPSIPSSSTGSGLAYYSPSRAELGIMSPFAPQGEAGYGHEDIFPYRTSHEPGSGLDTGAGVGAGTEAYTAGGGGLGAGMGISTGTATAMGFDDDAFAMWSDVPAGFELTEWGDFLSGFSDVTTAQQGQFHGASGGSAYPATGRA